MLVHIRPLNVCRTAGKKDMRGTSVWCLDLCNKILLSTLPKRLGSCQFDTSMRHSLCQPSSITSFYHFLNFLYSQIFVLFMGMQIQIGCFSSSLTHHSIEYPISKPGMSSKTSTFQLYKMQCPIIHVYWIITFCNSIGLSSRKQSWKCINCNPMSRVLTNRCTMHRRHGEDRKFIILKSCLVQVFLFSLSILHIWHKSC